MFTTMYSSAADSYVRRTIRPYRVTTGDAAMATALRAILLPTIQSWAGGHLARFVFSGSYAKGTAIRGRTDVDLFISLKSSATENLGEIYEGLFGAVRRAGWNATKRDVAIKVQIGPFNVDLVPARRWPGQLFTHSIYRNRASTWTKTNIDRHVAWIKESQRTTEICVIKLWAVEHGLEFPSFPLELAVIKALAGAPIGRHAINARLVFKYLGERFPDARLLDPANAANIVSDSMTRAEKKSIAQAAETAATSDWTATIW